jgi:thioesterase domain-containing protein
MTTDEVQQYLYDHIPLSKAMQVSVIALSDSEVILSAPLAPNINHRDTVFGGSASALAILAAWSLLYLRLRNAGVESRIVIQRNTMDYQLPMDGEFFARSSLTHPEEWDRFMRMLTSKGRARISVSSTTEFEGKVTGQLVGEFVALGSGQT